MRKQKDQYLSEINHLESENKRYLDVIVRYSRGQRNSLTGLSFASGPTVRQVPTPTNIIRPPEPAQKGHPRASVPSHNITQMSNYISGSSRSLTLKQLKDSIEEIYEAKLKFDQKNFDGRIPRETMHQYLFTHLNQKYGLKVHHLDIVESDN